MDFGAKLTAVQFEELCHDLLIDLGYIDISWRKGTPLDASPSDQGRDLEAILIRSEPDGGTHRERWFVECKHWKSGVPPSALQSALSWAMAESPTTLLIIVSGFLSNPTKEYLRKYEENQKPKFRIRVWEADKLEQLLFGRARILNKFGLAPAFPFTQILHPAHFQFLRNPPINTLSFFFKVLDALNYRERHSWFFSAFLYVINPEFAEPESLDQTLGELAEQKVSYHEFRKALSEATYSEIFLIQSVIGHTLTCLLAQGDTTSLQELLDNHRRMIGFFQNQLEICPAENRQTLESCIQLSEEKMATLEQDLADGYKSYCNFCEKVLIPLFEEKPIIPKRLSGSVERDHSAQKTL